jgi:hypothetical protein
MLAEDDWKASDAGFVSQKATWLTAVASLLVEMIDHHGDVFLNVRWCLSQSWCIDPTSMEIRDLDAPESHLLSPNAEFRLVCGRRSLLLVGDHSSGRA